jgi:hypothetical protein
MDSAGRQKPVLLNALGVERKLPKVMTRTASCPSYGPLMKAFL